MQYYFLKKIAISTLNTLMYSKSYIIKCFSASQHCGCQYPQSKVKIDELIDYIPDFAFYGVKIQELVFHPNICSIGYGSFAKCSIKLNNLTILHFLTITIFLDSQI